MRRKARKAARRESVEGEEDRSTTEGSQAAGFDPGRPLQSPERVRWAVAGLAAVGTLELGTSLLGLSLDGYRTEGATFHAYHGAVRALDQLSSLCTLVEWTVVAAPFLGWLQAAWRDAAAIRPGASMAFTPSSATWGFFIPIVNLVRPWKVLSALQDAADPALFDRSPHAEERPAGYRDEPRELVEIPEPPTAPVGAWALTWVLANALGRVMSSTTTEHGSALALQLMPRSVAAALAVAVVTAIDARLIEQHRRALSEHLGEGQPPQVDPRRLGATTSAAIALAASALAAAASSLSLGAPLGAAPTLLVGLLTGLGVLGASRVGASRRTARGTIALALAVAAATMAPGAVALRARLALLARGAETVKTAFEQLEASVALVDSEERPADIGRRLDEQLAAIERLADATPGHHPQAYRCFARREHEIALARLAFARSADLLPRDNTAISEGERDAALVQHLEALRDSSTGLRTALGPAGTERVLGCLRDHDAAPEQEAQYRKERVKRDQAPELARLAAHAARASAQLAELALLDEGGAGRPGDQAHEAARAAAALATQRAWREEHRALRAEQGEAPKLEAAPLFEARKSFETKISLDLERGPTPAAPQGLIKSNYKGPLGKMLAYESPRPRDPGARAAVLWVPGAEDFADDLAAAQELARSGIVVMLPTVRGTFTNPGRRDWNFGEIDDLAAAKAHLASLPHVDTSLILVAGVDEGGTRALLLSAAVDGLWTVVAFEPQLDATQLSPVFPLLAGREGELRSPARMARYMQSSTHVAESDTESLVLADAMSEAAPADAVRPVAGKPGTLTAATLVKLVKQKLERPSMVINDEAVEEASKGLIRRGAPAR